MVFLTWAIGLWAFVMTMRAYKLASERVYLQTLTEMQLAELKKKEETIDRQNKSIEALRGTMVVR